MYPLNKPEQLFEVSWEVCNKVGGINTVLKSKARLMVKNYGPSFFMVGPFIPQAIKGEFVQKLLPEEFREAIESLKTKGIICHYGQWLIEGQPNTILIESEGFASRYKDEIKTQFWEKYGIDSLNSNYYDYDVPLLWSVASAMVIDEITKSTGLKTISHFHEWLAGGGILYLKSVNSKVLTVFTTHATMLGRTISGNGRQLYEEIEHLNPDQEAYRYGIAAKHLTEKACARNATVFTTVSEITSFEAEHLLGKKPDIITENGLDIDKYPSYEEASIKHVLYRNKIRDFLLYHFLPYYDLDINHNLIFFVTARYEFISKGLDVFIDALGKLNKQLKTENSERTATVFFWIPAGAKGIKDIVIKNKTFFEDYEELIEDNEPQLLFNLKYLLLSSKTLNEENLIDEDISLELKRRILNLKSQGLPSTVTHYVDNEEHDPILNAFAKNGLNNDESDKIKVIFYPVYLNGADGILDLSYQECILGSHLGVFPSIYEPWGYTPLEAAALGVPSITTDLAGFGRFVEPKIKNKSYKGIFVADFMNKSREERVGQLSQLMHDVLMLKKAERIKLKIDAKTFASLADWKIMFNKYMKAYDLALSSKEGEDNGA